MDDALFNMPTAPLGNMRKALDSQLAKYRADGYSLAEDLAIVAQSLADRIDAANSGGDRRGYVMLTAEYRNARRELLEGVTKDDGGTGSLAAAIADFRAATVGDPA